MTEAQLYEKIGRLQTELDAERATHELHLRVLAEVVSGECDRSRVLVNLTDGTVTWSAPGQRPAMPMTINGVPVCVVAPEEPKHEAPPLDLPEADSEEVIDLNSIPRGA